LKGEEKMNYIFWIILGVIIGWVVEWVIDWLFWRKPGDQSLEELTLAEAENGRLQAQLAEAEQKLTNLTLTEREAKICQVKLADAEETIEQLRAELNVSASQAPQEEDLLERIKGVGTGFAQRFSDSGIFTFQQYC
jgi:predicted flap endonuclease-1-like 5' DNA nuclease